jgi:hypothetical protein
MAFLDFITNRNAAPQQPVAPMPQPQTPPAPTVASLPDPVKTQAVEAARPAAVLMEKATTPRTTPAQPQVGGGPGRSRALGMER